MDGMDKDEGLRVLPRPVRRQVEDGLRAAIMRGRFLPGEHLPDRLLTELFGASRSVVREAVRLLEAEGLVVVVPNRGPFVAFLSPEEAAQVYEVRGVLEALAGAGFAERATPEERGMLRRIYEELAAAGPDTDREALLALKRRFYDVLLAGCRNAYVARMLDQLLNRNAQLRATSLSDPERLPQTVTEIRLVVEAIERRDPDAAWKACRDHVESAAAVALRVLRRRSLGHGAAEAGGEAKASP
ncbi:GntR family transcriptional regulator [Roseomonas harenae]|jgi:DNA-binding GntR family transcriptional regulator|uniref:GntR family transcriptional regulator n=1 Tax=Muricoccus harenae TaxID=2692566 RepID=UPI001F3ABC68|nr:GntR family transcriptional regulator [Roseomonas harenae]